MKYYNRTNSCDICKENFNNVVGKPRLKYNKEGDWTGKYICTRCWRKYDLNSNANIQKSLRNRRTGNLTDSRHILGNNCEELTCRWRGVDNLNIKNDNYNSPIDHSRDRELGIIQTKGLRFVSYPYGRWPHNYDSEHNKEFDYIILYCLSEDGKYVDRIYIIPKCETIYKNGLTITKEPRNKYGKQIISWYEKYRVTNEKTIKEVNEIWKEIIKE